MSILQVTPNGPYGKDVHPAMPETLHELLEELRGCFLGGAGGVHLHVRDEEGRESLDPRHVNPTVEAVRNVAIECGMQVEVGLTTGAWIVPSLSERIGLIRNWVGVDCATVNLSEEGFEKVMAAMLDVGIGIDVGLWDISEVPAMTASGLLDQVVRISIELEPGEPYFPQGDPVELAGAINDALDEAGSTCPRLTHGAGDWTWPLVRDALRRGHATRVGFEDSTRMPDGSVAASNTDLVKAVGMMSGPS